MRGHLTKNTIIILLVLNGVYTTMHVRRTCTTYMYRDRCSLHAVHASLLFFHLHLSYSCLFLFGLPVRPYYVMNTDEYTMHVVFSMFETTYMCDVHVRRIHVSHAGTVVPECFKDDNASQWKSGKFDPRSLRNP